MVEPAWAFVTCPLEEGEIVCRVIGVNRILRSNDVSLDLITL
jgi:hypothetical protein